MKKNLIISNNIHIHKLNQISEKNKNTYHNTTKMKPVDVNLSDYIDLNVENNGEDPEFKVGDHVRISK